MSAQDGQTRQSLSPQRLLEFLCAILLFMLMMLTAIDVFGRYLLNAPVSGSFQIAQALMGLLIFAGLPLITARDEHLRAGLLDHLFSGRFNSLRQPLIDLFSLGAMAALTWRLWADMGQKHRSGELLPVIDIPIWTLIVFMVAMASIATAVLAWLAVARIRGRSTAPTAT